MKDIKDQTVLAVDPSINSCGVAIFKSGKLMNIDTIKAPKGLKDEDIMYRCLRISQSVVAWLVDLRMTPTTLVVEWPQIYPGPGRKNPNNLFGLAGVNGCIAGMLSTSLAIDNQPFQVISALPREWAKRQPKTKSGDAKLSVRARGIYRRLDSLERVHWDVKKLSHDAIDALGIGLFALGRTDFGIMV